MAVNPKLIVLSKVLRGQAFELTKQKYTIGRTDDNDICVPDGTVSSHHAYVEKREDGDYYAMDNGSTNGTRVNGVKTDGQKLMNTDILQCGGVELLFDSENKDASKLMSTQTAINLDESAGNAVISETMNNISPFSKKFKKSKKGKLDAKIKYSIIGAVTTLTAIIIFLAFKLLTA